ncbi:hypothetical protein GCM10009743_07900 [Kribbella swartbergensis]
MRRSSVRFRQAAPPKPPGQRPFPTWGFARSEWVVVRERGANGSYDPPHGAKEKSKPKRSRGQIEYFERAGFTRAADTASTLAGHPRILMRLDLG